MGLLSYKVYGDYLSIVNGYSIKISGSQRFPVECELLQGRDTKLQPLTFTLLKKKEKDTQKTRTRTHKNHKCIFVESGVSRRRIPHVFLSVPSDVWNTAQLRKLVPNTFNWRLWHFWRGESLQWDSRHRYKKLVN